MNKVRTLKIDLAKKMQQNTNSIICLAGKNEIAVFGLHLLLEHVDKINIRIVCNSTDLGIDTWQPSLLKAARENDISVISIEDCYHLKNLIFLSLEFEKIITPSKFLNAKLFNIHFSNLPAYKGMFTSALPLLNGESEGGVTLHEIDSGIDTGDIIDQIEFSISEGDNARDLYNKYLSHSKELLAKNLAEILKGVTTSTPQASIGSTYYSAKAIDYNNLDVNLVTNADQIRNQIRAYTFPEYQVPKVHGYFVNSASVQSMKSSKKPGTLVSVTATELIVSTLDFDVILHRDKNSELFRSAITNDIELAIECTESGADINARQGNGWTPVIVSSFNGSIDVLRIIIQNGADVNITNYKGTTPLMYAMTYYEKSGQRDLFDLLLESGAMLELYDMHQKTIRDYAIERKVLGLFSIDG